MRYTVPKLLTLIAVAAWAFHARPFSFVLWTVVVALVLSVFIYAWQQRENNVVTASASTMRTVRSPANKRAAGLYEKFRVERTDGRSAPGEKHHGCEYFVLDLNHDPFAVPALVAYRDACVSEYPALARDLETKVVSMTPLGGRF